MRACSVISVCLILAIALTIFPSLPCYSESPESLLGISARSAALIDAAEGELLFGKNERERLPMASTTKIMTALVVAELLEPDEVITVPRDAVGIEGSSVYLAEGEMFTVSELLHALLLESANDAAVALAIAASGSIENFAKKCNEKVQSLQLRDTNFTNPHGLYEREHYTTAYDLAVISAQAMKIPQIREITAKKSATVPLGVTKDNPDGEGVRRLNNHNKMLSRYEGAIGIKTGFTKKSGRCLASAAERDSLTLIAVTLNAPDDWNDHKRLLDFGFSRFERRTVFGAGEFCFDFPLSNANEEYIRAVNLSPIEFTVPKTARSHSHCVEAGFRFAVAPVKAGQILGELTVEIDGKIRRSTLVAEKSVGSKDKKRSLLDFIKIKD